MKSDEIVSLNLREAVASAKSELLVGAGSFGSVVFRFSSNDASNAFASAVVRADGHPIDFHFDSYDTGSTAVEGIWWLPSQSSTTYLVLSNPTNETVTGTLVLSDASGTNHSTSVKIGPRQTQRNDMREFLGSAASGGYGGLSLYVDKAGSVFATEIAFDEVIGTAATMKLFDRELGDKVKGRVLRAPMMALSQPDRSLGFPSGTTLQPKIVLRNAGTTASIVAPGVNWINQTQTGSSLLAPVTLLPGEIRTISLADFQKSGQIPVEADAICRRH